LILDGLKLVNFGPFAWHQGLPQTTINSGLMLVGDCRASRVIATFRAPPRNMSTRKTSHAPQNISAGPHLKFAAPAIATSAAGSKLRAPDQPKTKIDVVYGDVLISP
jgi:hypothetical protein